MAIPSFTFLWKRNRRNPGLGVTRSVDRVAVIGLSRHLLWLSAIMWLVVMTPAWELAGQEPLTQDDDLPAAAVWRIGEVGNLTKPNGIYRLVFSADGRLMAARNQDNQVSVVDLSTRANLMEIEGHESRVETIDFSPDSQFLITAAGPGEELKIWNVQTGKLESVIKTDAAAAYFDATGSRIHVLGATHVETYAWPGAQLIDQRKWQTGNEIRRGMSRDGRLVVMYRSLSSNVFQTLVMDMETRSKVQLEAPTSELRSVCITEDRNWLAASFNRDQRTRLWDLRDPLTRSYLLDGHEEPVQSLAFSSDDRFLVSTSWDDTAILYDLVSQQSIHRYEGHNENVNASAFAPFQFRFATGASGRTDCSILLWDFSTWVRPPVQPGTIAEFDSIWEGLGDAAFSTAILNVARIVEGAPELLEPAEQKISEVASVQTSGTVLELVSQLDHPAYAVRERATLQLIRLRVEADSQLRIALENEVSPEVRYRIRRVLRQEVKRPPRDLVNERRWARLIFALEQINSEKSLSLLKLLADGHPDVDISRQARTAWQRAQQQNQLKAAG